MTMRNKRLRQAAALLLSTVMVASLAGCVDQKQGKLNSDSSAVSEETAENTSGSASDASGNGTSENSASNTSDKDTSDADAKSLLEIDDPEEKAAVEAAKKIGRAHV